MNKTVIVAHGWEGHPKEGWFPWLKKELETKNFKVIIPQLPNPKNPRIKKWTSKLTEITGSPNNDTYFIGHSMGCQAIVRYLETLESGIITGGSVFVSGFFKRLTDIGEEPDTKKTEEHWLQTPVDLEKAAAHMEKSIAIFSDDDPWVPLDNQNDFKNKLHSKIIIKHNHGHFSGERDKCFELPIVLESLLEITKK